MIILARDVNPKNLNMLLLNAGFLKAITNRHDYSSLYTALCIYSCVVIINTEGRRKCGTVAY